MKGSPNGVSAFDPRILSLLGALHDVQGAPKTAISPNGSAKNKLETLIDRGFVLETPVPFSNTRLCSITDRGRVLYDALTLTEAIWDSDRDTELRFRIVSDREEPVVIDDGTEEPSAKTPTAVETVQVILPIVESEEEPASEEPIEEPQTEDEKVGVNVSETESVDPTSEGGDL